MPSDFLTLIQLFDSPIGWDVQFFETTPSRPRSQTAANILLQCPSASCRTGLSRLRIAPAEAVLGHAAPAIVRTYDVHDLADEKRHAPEAWAGLVQRTVSPVDNVVAIRQ